MAWAYIGANEHQTFKPAYKAPKQWFIFDRTWVPLYHFFRLLLLPPYDLWGAPYEMIKMPLSVTRATNTPQNTLQL
jgi:hypothetical protein